MSEVTTKATVRTSSFKPGHTVEHLLDSDDLTTFLQSDGQLPHYLQIDFTERTILTEIRLYLDYSRDESYTPCEIQILAGDHASDLIDFKLWNRIEASGWVPISLRQENGNPLPIFSLRLVIRANNNNGKDSRIRAIKLISL